MRPRLLHRDITFVVAAGLLPRTSDSILMLPTNEIDTLTRTVTDPMDLAHEGRVADGYACLVWSFLESRSALPSEVYWSGCGGAWGPARLPFAAVVTAGTSGQTNSSWRPPV